MAAPAAALIAAAALPAAISYLGGAQANAANVAAAKDTNAMNWNNARAQEQFQERMANSAHQRQVKDLEAAGLNPTLSANTGAAVPGGASSTAVAPKIENAMAPAVSSALEGIKIHQEMKAQSANIASIEQGIKTAKAQERKNNMETTVMSKDIPKAEIINEVYDTGRKILKNIKGDMFGTSAKDNRNLQNYKNYYKKN